MKSTKETGALPIGWIFGRNPTERDKNKHVDCLEYLKNVLGKVNGKEKQLILFVKLNIYQPSSDGRPSIVKMFILPKAFYGFNVICIKIPNGLLS